MHDFCVNAIPVEVNIFESFSRIGVDGQIRFENARRGRRFFHIRRKDSLVSKISGYV